MSIIEAPVSLMADELVAESFQKPVTEVVAEISPGEFAVRACLAEYFKEYEAQGLKVGVPDHLDGRVVDVADWDAHLGTVESREGWWVDRVLLVTAQVVRQSGLTQQRLAIDYGHRRLKDEGVIKVLGARANANGYHPNWRRIIL